MYWILIVYINIGGIRFQNYEGAFESYQQCVSRAQSYTTEKYFEKFECQGRVK